MRVERVLAPNPGPYTGSGTNSYVVSAEGDAVILDPGPVIDGHLAAIERAVDGLVPQAVLVTHTHPDHAPAANVLGDRWRVPVLGYAAGPHFEPTQTLGDGDEVAVGSVALTAVHTPGHTADHLCYRMGRAVFTGDHVIGGSTVIIEDAAAYMRSLRRVLDLAPDRLYPGHGPVIEDGSAAIEEYLAHRLERERQVMAAIGAGGSTVADIVSVVYADVDPSLRNAAAHQVETQLQKLVAEGRLTWRRSGSHHVVELVRAEESE
jgi:glyoxylase-like metal-dependent hydrolase (beta-lactamase superfamily II)